MKKTTYFLVLITLVIAGIIVIPFFRYKLINKEVVEETNNNIKIIAHRGASQFTPENTFASFESAISMNTDFLELDVHLTKDDSIVVIHDETLNRTTTGKGKIQEHSYAALTTLSAGSWFDSKFSEEKVPLLSEVIRRYKNKATILVELKNDGTNIYKGLVDKLVQVIKKNDASASVIVQSFYPEYLVELTKKYPDIKCCQLIVGQHPALPLFADHALHVGKFFPVKGIYAINIYYLFLTKSLVDHYHQQNLKVYTYTINSRADALRAVSTGTDGIITNNPAVLEDGRRKSYK